MQTPGNNTRFGPYAVIQQSGFKISTVIEYQEEYGIYDARYWQEQSLDMLNRRVWLLLLLPLALVVDDQVQLETIEASHGAAIPHGQPIETHFRLIRALLQPASFVRLAI